MGKPQKNKRMAEVENSEGAAKERNSVPSQTIENHREIEMIEAKGRSPVSPCDAASYVHEMAYELKGIAESAKLSFLSYLLDLVIEESGIQKRGRL